MLCPFSQNSGVSKITVVYASNKVIYIGNMYFIFLQQFQKVEIATGKLFCIQTQKRVPFVTITQGTTNGTCSDDITY